MKKTLASLLVLTLGFGAIFFLSRRLERIQPKPDENRGDSDLYLSAEQLKLAGADFRGLIADWYWINSLQYLGGKLLNNQEKVNINDLRPLNPRLLYPMLDRAATLDPQFSTVYSYGAAVLPAIDPQQAVKLLEKGIAADPEDWRLYQNLGYIYWQQNDYMKAARIYAEGAAKPDAPVWMRQMSANMQAQGGDRFFALEVYRQMFETAEDEQSRTFAKLRYLQAESLIERDFINAVLEDFQRQKGHCADSWAEITGSLRRVKLPTGKSLDFNETGAPRDPSGVAYRLSKEDGKCTADLDFKKSKIPYR